MMRPVGYYVHHQGAGHLHRARMITEALDRPFMLFGSFGDRGEASMTSLPDDRMDAGFDGDDGSMSRPDAMHYAPIGHEGVRLRMAAIAEWIGANDPALMVVDVSVEVALLTRLLSVPVMTVRLAGRRTDQPHLEAFRASDAVLAPFPVEFEDPETPEWVREKTIYAGFLAQPGKSAVTAPIDGEVAVVMGLGGAPLAVAHLVEAARVTPDWTWRVYGLTTIATGTDLPANLHLNGWVDTIGAALDRASIVVGGAGDGLLAAVVARSTRFICIPESRAFDEQLGKAKVLEALNVAVVLPQWPDPSYWPCVMARAKALDPRRLQSLGNGDAVAKAIAAIEAICRRRA